MRLPAAQRLFLMTSVLFVLAPAAWGGGPPDEPVPEAKAKPGVIGKVSAEKLETPVSGAGVESVTASSAAMSGKAPPRRTGVLTTTPMPPTIRKVSVLIESSPSNCGIEVDGVYIGVTPVQVSMKEGVHHVRISKEGYLPWERPVKAYHGLYVNPTLVQESTRKRDLTESATAK